MRAARGKAKNDVARLDAGAVDDAVLFNHADGKAREVVFTFRVHAGHFGGFAADQCAAGKLAAFRDACNNARGDVDVKFSAGVIVKEEKALAGRNPGFAGL